MKVKSRDAFATSVAATHDGSIDLDKPIFTLSVASEILEVHPRTLMMYEHLSMISPKDRKSTRLNSSHRTSSYAVFCLKKKIVSVVQVVGVYFSSRVAMSVGRDLRA